MTPLLYWTIGGEAIDLRDPKPEQIHIGDIACGLAHTCRFGGQVRTLREAINGNEACEPVPGPDASPAICIGKWGCHAPEVGKVLPKGAKHG